jgi:cysteine desulfurase
VFEAMTPWFLTEPGNSGSRTHVYGQRAKDAVERSRDLVASHFSATPEEIVFTSGATESNNLALLGMARHGERVGKKHILASSIEHKAVLEPLEYLGRNGFEIELLPVTAGGFVEPDSLRSRIRRDTLLISVMHSNNETGVLQPIEEIGQIAQSTGILFHVDAAQTFGKEVETLRTLPCDFASISAHKIYGPKGIGALLVRRKSGTRRMLDAITFGGGQERGLRPGTVAVPLVVGLGKASELAQTSWRERQEQARQTKAAILDGLASVEFLINGDQDRCQPHVLNLSFVGIDSEAFMMATRELIAVSNGSACTSTAYTPSHVLLAMGLDDARIESAIRFSWGYGIAQFPANQIIEAIDDLQ